MGSIKNATSYRLNIYELCLVLFSVLFFMSPSITTAERLRSEVQHTLTVDENKTGSSISIGLRKLSLIQFNSEEFLRGIVIKVETPQAVLQFRESFMLTLYHRISPKPQEGVSSYSASKLYSTPFPSSPRTFIDIPISSQKDWNKSALNSTVVSTIPQPSDFPILLSIDPIMKGIPSDVASSRFKITVNPVFIDKGALVVELPEDVDKNALQLFIDSQSANIEADKYILPTGVHTVEINSDRYLPFSKSVGIEKAQFTTVKVQLEPSTSSILFDAPNDAVIFFDGKEVQIDSNSEIETDPGEHMVLVRIGDYSVSKKIDIQGGKTYKVSLFFDILINDN